MEGGWPSTCADTLHVCNRWQPYRLYSQGTDAFFTNRGWLVMDSGIYRSSHPDLAIGCSTYQFSFRAVPVFYQLPEKNRKENGVGEK